jgi:hypothetical protein
MLDVLASPVIELSGCFFDGAILRRGRMYYVDGYYDAGQWKVKPEAFRSWAKTILTRTRKALKKLPGFEYIGPGAEAWLASSGGKLVQM